MSNFSSNLSYRQYLVQNTDSIITKNQLNACTNCSDTQNFNINNNLVNNSDNYMETGSESDFATKIKYLKQKFIEASSAAPCIDYLPTKF